MSQAVILFGIPGVPYANLTLESPITTDDVFTFEGRKFSVTQADEVTHDNQLQNVYIKEVTDTVRV